MKTDYIKALNDGREIVVIAAENNQHSDSAIFYRDSNKMTYTFNRSFGNMKRPELNDERLKKHFESMERENAHIFIRGSR